MNTLILVLEIIIIIIGFYGFWMFRDYSRRVGKYEADLEYLPKLTKQLDLIKAQVHRSTELNLGLKGEERQAIYAITVAFSLAIKNCMFISDLLSSQHTEAEVDYGSLELSKSLRELQFEQSKFEIICDDTKLREMALNLVLSIFQNLHMNAINYLNERKLNSVQHSILQRKLPAIKELKVPQEQVVDLLNEWHKEVLVNADKMVEITKNYVDLSLEGFKIVNPAFEAFKVYARGYLKRLLEV